MGLKVIIEGDREVMDRLKTVETAVQRKIVKKAVSAATRAVLREEKSRAPRSDPDRDPALVPGLLGKSLGSVVKLYPSGVAAGVVGPRSETVRKRRRLKTFLKGTTVKYRDLSGFGRSAERLRKKRGTPKALEQKPSRYAHLAGPGRREGFASGAAEASGAEATEILNDEIARGVEEAWNK